MVLTPGDLERISHVLTELQNLENSIGIVISDDYGSTYLKVDDQMIRFSHNSTDGYVLVEDHR